MNKISERDKRYNKYKQQATFYHSYLHGFVPKEYQGLSTIAESASTRS